MISLLKCTRNTWRTWASKAPTTSKPVEILPFIIQVNRCSMLPFPFIILNPVNWLNWPCWLFTPMFSDYCGWIALSSNSQPKSNVTITLLHPSREITALSCWCIQRPSQKQPSFFSPPWLFFVFSRSFFFLVQPITFLLFHQRTFISEIWLHLLWFLQRHCVSSLKQKTALVTAGCRLQHLSSSKWHVTCAQRSERFTYKARPSFHLSTSMFTIHIWR